MLNILHKLYEWLKGWGPLAKIMAVAVAGIIAILEYFNAIWLELFERVDGLAVSGFPDSINNFQPLGLANYVFPLDTMLNYFSAYLVLRVACYVIRIIKSWIPTVS